MQCLVTKPRGAGPRCVAGGSGLRRHASAPGLGRWLARARPTGTANIMEGATGGDGPGQPGGRGNHGG